MTRISEAEFARICDGVSDDREAIFRHNPIETEEQTLLWMLLGCLICYLSLPDQETPCFTGRPDARTYRKAILFVLKDRRLDNFDPEIYLSMLTGSEPPAIADGGGR